MYTGQFTYCGHHVTLPIGDALPLCRTFEGAIICNVEHHVSDCGALPRASRDYAIIISRNPNNGTSAGASRDCAIVISRNLDNGTYARASRDYAIVISHNPDNGVRARSVSHR